MHGELSNVCMGNGCFKGTFSLEVNDHAKTYQAQTEVYSISTSEAIQERTRKAAKTPNAGITLGG